MPIKYDKLRSILKSRGLPVVQLRNDKIVVGQSFSNLQNDKSISVNTIDAICKYLNVQPGDIMEYVPDEDEAKEDAHSQG